MEVVGESSRAGPVGVKVLNRQFHQITQVRASAVLTELRHDVLYFRLFESSSGDACSLSGVASNGSA